MRFGQPQARSRSVAGGGTGADEVHRRRACCPFQLRRRARRGAGEAPAASRSGKSGGRPLPNFFIKTEPKELAVQIPEAVLGRLRTAKRIQQLEELQRKNRKKEKKQEEGGGSRCYYCLTMMGSLPLQFCTLHSSCFLCAI